MPFASSPSAAAKGVISLALKEFKPRSEELSERGLKWGRGGYSGLLPALAPAAC